MCGIAGIFGRVEGHPLIYILRMLSNLLHRGQEGYGVSLLDERRCFRVKRSTVSPLFNLLNIHIKQSMLDSSLRFIGGVAHTRYSTTGPYDYPVQPVLISTGDLSFSLVFNGTLSNYCELLGELRSKSMEDTVKFAPQNSSVTDAHVLSLLIAWLTREHHGDVVEAVRDLSRYVVGAYSLIVLTNEPRLIFARDAKGFRPLVYGQLGDSVVVASETAALETIGIEQWIEVSPGEVVSCDGASIERSASVKTEEATPCVFEYVYFSRPDSVFNGVSVYKARLNMGALLAEIDHVEADVVIPVPEGGRIVALGYSEKKGLPFHEGLIVNKYLGRSFIMSPTRRDIIASLKYGVVRQVVDGKRVILVDDSIVRGTTMRRIVRALKTSGAKEVHVRIGSPPFKCPCYMGIDVGTLDELLFNNCERDCALVSREIEADSLLYNTLDNVIKAVGLPSLCHACFSCVYPFTLRESWVKSFEKRRCI